MAQLDPGSWALLALAAVLFGLAKTAFSGAGALGVVLFAAVLPARESTGVVLPLLICGDLVAVAVYGRHTRWGVLARLVPWVALGVLAGSWFVGRADDDTMRVALGVVLVTACAIGLATRGERARAAFAAVSHGLVGVAAAAVAGILAGFATMVANAAGPVMSVYLLLSGLAVLSFLGTTSWFFLVVNVAKLPFSIGLGLVTPSALLLDAALLPAMAVGAAAGVWLVRRVRADRFEQSVLMLSLLSAALLLV